MRERQALAAAAIAIAVETPAIALANATLRGGSCGKVGGVGKRMGGKPSASRLVICQEGPESAAAKRQVPRAETADHHLRLGLPRRLVDPSVTHPRRCEQVPEAERTSVERQRNCQMSHHGGLSTARRG
jgi:hypothetical protein